MAKLTTVYWRDIPAQVIAKSGRSSFKKVLSPRFAIAIDRAAMRAGKGGSDAYLNDWRRDSRQCSPEELVDLQFSVDLAAEKLESEFPDDFLNRVVKTGGALVSADGAIPKGV